MHSALKVGLIKAMSQGKMMVKKGFFRGSATEQLSIAILEQPLQSMAEGWLLITAAIGKI
jgi:hypothetical protein